MNANIETLILKTISEHRLMRENDKVIVGVSGGPDSVCLLHALAGLRDGLGIVLIAAHLNHMIRGADAAADAEYVVDLCAALGIRCILKSEDVPKLAEAEKISLETAGRLARYAFFREALEDAGAQSIAVAHNRNDRAETIIMNIIRGTGPEGLAGIDYRNGDIIRPLLDADRRDIESYCAEKGLSPRTDQTNSDNIHTRNKIRNAIIPAMNSIPGTDVTRSVLRLSDIIAEDAGYLNLMAEEAAHEVLFIDADRKVIINTAEFKKLHGAVAGRVARIAVRIAKGDLNDIDALHVRKITKLVGKGRNGSYIELPNGITVHKSYGSVILQNGPDAGETDDGAFPIRFETGEPQVFSGGILKPSVVNANEITAGEISDRKGSDLKQYFDMGKVGENAVLRHRMAGDRFRNIGSAGAKKLNDVFIDRKIPAGERGKVLLLAEGNEIIWIIGYNINENYKVDEKTAAVLKLEVEIK